AEGGTPRRRLSSYRGEMFPGTPFPNWPACARFWRGVVESSVLAGRCILRRRAIDLARRHNAAAGRGRESGRRFAAGEGAGIGDCPELAAGVLDFDLGKVDSTPVPCKLVDRRVPFVFHSGRMYSAFRQWPRAQPTTQALIGAIVSLIHSARG